MDEVKNKINVLMLSIVYPLAMSTYFKRAFQRRDDVDFVDCGPYTGSWIAWMGGMNVLDKYAIPPVVPLPFPPNVGVVDYGLVRAMLNNMGRQEWKPDLVLTVDAGIHWTGKPSEGLIAHVATDPHVLNYDYQRRISDKFFNMQAVYSAQGDILLPYAFDSDMCKPMDIEKDTDAVLIGMPYESRIAWVEELRKHGVSVLFENGPIFDEYQVLNNRARIGLNWSSLDDLNCRVFELMAMRLCPIVNRVSAISSMFTEGVHYVGFNTISEAVTAVLWAKENPEKADEIAKNAHDRVWELVDGFPRHSYDKRVDQILKECGFYA